MTPISPDSQPSPDKKVVEIGARAATPETGHVGGLLVAIREMTQTFCKSPIKTITGQIRVQEGYSFA